MRVKVNAFLLISCLYVYIASVSHNYSFKQFIDNAQVFKG